MEIHTIIRLETITEFSEGYLPFHSLALVTAAQTTYSLLIDIIQRDVCKHQINIPHQLRIPFP